ncbi:MAG: exodeoxyribonuclease III [Pseudomonadota bacterium]
MKIATWNINGVKARLETVCTWLKESQPDVACLQEIKSIDENFPSERFEELGYNVATHGQKGFNGVAIFSKIPFDEVTRRLPGDDDDEQARYIEAVVGIPKDGDGEHAGVIRVASLYLPNGNPLGSEKFPYKLGWMERLEGRAKVLLEEETPFILAGDYNVIPEPRDCRNAKDWMGDALYQPESRGAFRALENLGFTDAIRATYPDDEVFTFWDYQAGAWQKNDGIRIDHLMMSPQAADLLVTAGVDKETRGWEKPSDHVPVWVEIGGG